MSIHVDIENALSDKTSAVALALALQVTLPNRVGNPPESGVYLECAHFKNTTTNRGWGNDATEYPGIWQITVVHGPDIGAIPLMQIADAIADAFPKGLILRNGSAQVKIEEKPSVLSALTDGQKTELPVSIRYRCFD